MASIAVSAGLSLTLLWRGITAPQLLAVVCGLLIVLAVNAVVAEIGYCHFDRNGCFNL
jgi:hypothetical protein